MLSTISINSLDQGNLFPKPKSEDHYYARYGTAADTGEPAVQQKTHTRSFLRFARAGLQAHVRRQNLPD